MGQHKVSRRKFFESLRQKQNAGTLDDYTGFGATDDPLFQLYARKKLGPREYRTEEVSYQASRLMDDDLRVGNVTSGLTPYAGAWSEWEVLHLLRRIGFGFKKSYVDAMLPLGPAAAVDYIMN